MKGEWRLFLDQNIRIEVKAQLQNRADIIHATDVHLQQALDPEILQYAIDNNRVLVTRDTNFGDLNIFPLPAHHPGVIRLRIDPPLPSVVAQTLLKFIERRIPDDVKDALVIISESKTRIRRHPSAQ